MKLSDKELNCMKMFQKAPKCADFSINPGEACPDPLTCAWHLQNSHSCILWIKTLTLILKLVATTLSIGWNYFRCVKVCQVHNDPPRLSMASRLLRSHENISCFKYCPPPPQTWNPGCAPAVLSLQCQTFGIQIRLDVLFGLIWVQPVSKDYYFAGFTTGIIPNSWPRILFD